MTSKHPPSRQRIDILLIEDNPGDARLVVEGFKQTQIACELHTVTDGEAALRYLAQEEPFAKATLPDLIILDLNLPRKNGHEVLKEVKSNPETKQIPVIVMSSSDSPEDINRSYELSANSYIVKPIRLDGFVRAIRAIDAFWINTASLPTR